MAQSLAKSFGPIGDHSAGPADRHPHSTPGHPGLPTCMAELDAGLTVRSASAEFYRQFARSSAQTCGRMIYDLLHPSARNILPRQFAALAEGRGSQFVERLVARRGEDRVFSAQLAVIPVRGMDDRLSGFLLLITPDESLDSDRVLPFRAKPLLTALDACILEGIATGASTHQLAARVYLSRQGVEYHVGLMLRQLNAPNRAALVSRAYSMGILTMGVWPPRAAPEFIKKHGDSASSASRARRATAAAAERGLKAVTVAVPVAEAVG